MILSLVDGYVDVPSLGTENCSIDLTLLTESFGGKGLNSVADNKYFHPEAYVAATRHN
jgi:hypothetical protein